MSINEGIAVDASLVKFASKPLSNDELRKVEEKHNTPEGNLDKNSKPVKFRRDLESDRTVKNDKPHYGFKEYASVDVNTGLISDTTVTLSSVNDSNNLRYPTITSCHTKDPIEKVYADIRYRSQWNGEEREVYWGD